MNQEIARMSASIELLVPEAGDNSPYYMPVAKLLIDPKLKIGEDLHLELKVGGQPYNLIAKVCKIQKHVVGKYSDRESELQVRYFVESENRKEVIDMWELINENRG